jgi:hypothetical protein
MLCEYGVVVTGATRLGRSAGTPESHEAGAEWTTSAAQLADSEATIEAGG